MDSLREKNGDLNNLGFLQKLSIRYILLCIFLTLGCCFMISLLGVNLFFLASGCIISLLFLTFLWKANMKRYNALAKQQVSVYSNRKDLFYVIIFLVVMVNFVFNSQSAQRAIFSGFGGFTVLMWLSYFQLIYWEKKNHKTIYFRKIYGTQFSYIVLEKNDCLKIHRFN
jgi:hypothetical protein